jgi:hypothetical protein
MTRRATRSPGARTRRPAAPATAQDALRTLRALESRRGTGSAERALEHWEESVSERPEVFAASAAALATGDGFAFTDTERWVLLASLAEFAEDEMLAAASDDLADRLDAEAAAWPGNVAGQLDEETLRLESPAYLALSEAYSALRTASEVLFLRDIGRADMARALLHEPATWERAMRDGEATLLGLPHIVLAADDDPFGILLP